MNTDPFKEYIKESEPDKRDKGYAWHTAIGLQAVDGLKTSEYLVYTAVRNIEGEISFEEANTLLQTYYEENPARDAEDRTEEADKVSARIAALLTERAFSFTSNEYLSIHRKLFTGIYSHVGRIRDYNITKNEWVLDGATEFLELFLRNLLLNEHHPLRNRTLHINRALKALEKVNIDNQKANIGAEKVNIKGMFTPKTATHVCELMEVFGSQIVFGRSDVQRVLGLKPTRSSALLHEMTERGVIEPVSRQGKGKYRFRKQNLASIGR